MNPMGRRLIFENGRQFSGVGFGTSAQAVAEVVFNTSMAGYQEIVSDPAYCAQMICMTYPLIGNYGLADEDYESRRPFLSGLIVREYNDIPSNYRYTRTLHELFVEHGVPGIAGVDTRAITRMLREEGGMRAIIAGADTSVEEGLERLSAAAAPRDQVRRVSCRKLWYSRTPNFRWNVVMMDYGVKTGIIRRLNAKGCNVTVLPCDTQAEQVRGLRPDGLLLSCGPGDPADVPEAAALVKALQGELSVLGIGLGHQIIALANGARTYKMKCGHRGGNHPVKNLQTGKIEITSQNHSYAVDSRSLDGSGLHLTHTDLLDDTVEGLRSDELRLFSVQYQPESAPDSLDGDAVFDRFIAHMERGRQEKEAQHAKA